MQANRLPALLAKHFGYSNHAHNLPDLLSKRWAGDHEKKDQPEKDSATFHPHPSQETSLPYMLAYQIRPRPVTQIGKTRVKLIIRDSLLVIPALDSGSRRLKRPCRE
jgi:hypothetical protein